MCGASYYHIRRPPRYLKRTKAISKLTLVTGGEEDPKDGVGEITAEDQDHDLDIILDTNEKITLNKNNSFFVREYIDLFIAENIIEDSDKFIQIQFDNSHEYDSLPTYCLAMPQ